MAGIVFPLLEMPRRIDQKAFASLSFMTALHQQIVAGSGW
jgi:hypothetical protein